MDDTKEWAVTHVEQLRGKTHPALRLRLGRQYNIEQWIQPALEQLVRLPLNRLQPIHTEWLGFPSYQIVART